MTVVILMQWAFGVTCWEIFSGGKTPYPGIHPMDLLIQLERGYRMMKPVNITCTDQVYVKPMLEFCVS